MRDILNQQMRIFVVVPAYNAEKTLAAVLDRIPKDALKEISKMIVINDGSSDKTKLEIEKLSKKYQGKIVALNHQKNKGYGAAQKTGFKEALRRKADISIVLHADGQYPPESIWSFITPIMRGEADIVAGSRHLGGNMLKQGMPFFKYAGNIILTNLLNCRFGQKLSSYHSGYKAYSKEALNRIDFDNLSNYYCFDTEMLIEASRNELVIKEIPIPTHYGDEESYLNPVKYSFAILGFILGGKK